MCGVQSQINKLSKAGSSRESDATNARQSQQEQQLPIPMQANLSDKEPRAIYRAGSARGSNIMPAAGSGDQKGEERVVLDIPQNLFPQENSPKVIKTLTDKEALIHHEDSKKKFQGK